MEREFQVMNTRLEKMRGTGTKVKGRKKFHDAWIDAGAVKFMVDGVIESHTAAMLEPYSDDPSLEGKPFWELTKCTWPLPSSTSAVCSSSRTPSATTAFEWL